MPSGQEMDECREDMVKLEAKNMTKDAHELFLKSLFLQQAWGEVSTFGLSFSVATDLVCKYTCNEKSIWGTNLEAFPKKHQATSRYRERRWRQRGGKSNQNELQPTEVYGQLDAASVQLQSQGVRRLLGSGGHQQAVRPLGHKAQRHILGLRVHGDRHDDLEVHAAIITQHCCLWTGVWRRQQSGWGAEVEAHRGKVDQHDSRVHHVYLSQ